MGWGVAQGNRTVGGEAWRGQVGEWVGVGVGEGLLGGMGQWWERRGMWQWCVVVGWGGGWLGGKDSAGRGVAWGSVCVCVCVRRG